MLVVQAAGSGTPAVGQSLASGASLTLPAGASVTLVSPDGHVLTLSGPYSGKPEQGETRPDASASGVSALSRMLTPRAAETNALGVIRGAAPQAGELNPARDAIRANAGRK
jgi:hypothetical protein